MIHPEHPDYGNTPVAPGRPVFPYLPGQRNPSPTVSVITPFYNTDRVFLDTAGSLLAQSFQDFEWIIVDDGSNNDESLAMLHATQAGDPRIKLIVQQNAGPAAARNMAFRHAGGRYLCLLDSDDMIEPTFIEKCVWFLESNPTFGFCNTWSVNFGDQEFLWTVGFERGSAHVQANSGPPIAVVRREAFAASGGFDESIRLGHEDWDFWLTLAKAGYWGRTLPEFQAWYRKRSSGRFHQVMHSASVNKDFETLIARKYAGLQAVFPAPVIKPAEPYENVPADIPFGNPLVRPENVRRILFLMPWMVTGGADKVNLDWVAALSRNGYQVTICATLEAHHNWLSEFAKLTPDIFILPNFLRCADFPRFLRYLMQSRQIETVLITGSTFGYLTLPYLRAHFPNTSFVDLSHVEEPHWMNGGHPRFGTGYQEMLDLNLVTTSNLRDWMTGRGADPGRIRVCHSGIDVSGLDAGSSARQQARIALGLAPDIPVIVFAGRICEQKRPFLLVDILQALLSCGAEFQALVVGDGELRQALESRLGEAKLLPRVRMLGTVGHGAWLQVLAASDIFLLPSKYEGISVALLEAMGMAVVPVTAAVGGQAELVTADCGFLIPHSDHELESYVDSVARLMADAPLREEMGRAARARILDGFSSDASTAGLLASLEEARKLSKAEPRMTISRGFAHDLATLAVEFARLKADMAWLVDQRDGWEKAACALEEQVMSLTQAMRDQEESWATAWREIRADNSWLSEQRDAWEKAACSREDQVMSLTQAMREQEESWTKALEEARVGNAWLSEQRDAWEKVSGTQAEQVTSLTQALERMRLGSAWLNEQRNAWEKVATISGEEIGKCHAALNSLMGRRLFRLLVRAKLLKLTHAPSRSTAPG